MAGSAPRAIVSGAGLALLGAGALIAASPPVGWWPLVFVAFVPMVLAQNRVLPARWSGLALALGFGGFLVWTLFGTFLPGQRWWFAPLVVGLIAGGRVSRLSWDATDGRHLWADPIAWTATLFVLALTPIASWIDPAYDLYGQPWLLQPISLVGIAGLNLLVMSVNYAVASLCITTSFRTRGVFGVLTAATLVVWVGSSVLMFAHHEAGRTVRVAVIQPGLTDLRSPADSSARASVAVATLTRLEAATRRAAQDGAQLVVWPEATLRYVDPEHDFGDRLRALAEQTRTYIVIGYSQDPARYNRATVLTPSGTFAVVYDKQHPVTFQGDRSIGGPVRVADTSLGRIAPIICYDLDYPQTARAAVNKGAQLLAVPSWDWSGIAEQHYTHLVFRAVENGVPAAKADTAWDSVIIDSDGRIRARHVSTVGEDAVLIANVRLGSGPTFYTRTGDVVGWATVATAAFWALIVLRAIRRAHHRGSLPDRFAAR